MRQLFLFIVAGSILIGCNNNKPEQDTTIMPLKNTTVDNNTISPTAVNQISPQQTPANSTTGMPSTSTALPQNITAGTTATGMNPEHGKPGHRCEISVGAPLNSVPAKTSTLPTKTAAQQTIVTQPTNIEPAILTPKTVIAKGMNPPHGEAGHRCDITVGAPLNSAPAAAKPAAGSGAANIAPMSVPTKNSSIVPALQNTSISTPAKTATGFTGKINPAHGQPGHDCKVAVGQTLP